jgi:hypothetical protein
MTNTTDTIELYPGVLFRRGPPNISSKQRWQFFADNGSHPDGKLDYRRVSTRAEGQWMPASYHYGDDILLDHIAKVHRDCQKLARAIADAGVESGHIAPGHQLDGPQLLMILADMVTMLQESRKIHEAIADPRLVFENMKAGTIAKISLRSAIDLHGEVINGDDAQQLEIAALRAEVAELRPNAARYLSMRDCPWPGSMQQVGIVHRENESYWLAGEEADKKVDAAMEPPQAQLGSSEGYSLKPF